jgi:undecaprenyl-diphosphatase
MLLYKIAEILGLVIILIALCYAALGFYQLIKRKSIFKVDRELIVLGLTYLLMLIEYLLFEMIIINYRPILMDGELEASYPSSHTILALCICFSSLITSKKYFNKKYIKQINIITVVLTGLVLLLRTISGVHWISDIIGGIIISLTLVSYYQLAYYYKKD